MDHLINHNLSFNALRHRWRMATVKICSSTFTLLKTITSKTSKLKQKNLRDYRKIFSTISFIFKPIFGPSSIRDPFSRNALPQVFLKSHLFFRKINKHVIFCSLSLSRQISLKMLRAFFSLFHDKNLAQNFAVNVTLLSSPF